MGGPGGIRVTQFGGGQPRRRPRAGEQQTPPQSIGSIIFSLLPVLLLFLFPLITSLFSGSGSVGPSFTVDRAIPPYTKKLTTQDLKIPYWINPSDFQGLSRSQRDDLDHRVNMRVVGNLQHQCEREKNEQAQLIMEAQGWWSTDEKLMAKARNMKLPACNRLRELKNMT
jgi:DnaJ homolog subfamily B member 12